MLDIRFKNLRLVSSFIGLEQSKAIVEEYDRKDLECHVVKMLSSFALLDLKMSLLTKVLMKNVVWAFLKY
jgi:hypothetical protein